CPPPALAEDGAEALHHDVLAGNARGMLEDRAVASVAAVLHADRAVPAVLVVLLGHRPRVPDLRALRMKALAVPGHVHEHRRRPEALAVPRLELLEHLDREARAQVVEVPE